MIVILFWFLLLLSFFLFFKGLHFKKKIRKIYSLKPAFVNNFQNSVMAGLVSGALVIVFDRVITQIVSNPLTIDFNQSIYDLLLSFVGLIVVLFFLSSLILFAIYFLFYHGVKE